MCRVSSPGKKTQRSRSHWSFEVPSPLLMLVAAATHHLVMVLFVNYMNKFQTHLSAIYESSIFAVLKYICQFYSKNLQRVDEENEKVISRFMTFLAGRNGRHFSPYCRNTPGIFTT